MSNSDAERISKLALQSLRDSDTAKFFIQLEAIHNVDPPEPVPGISEVEARADAEYRAWTAQREIGG